MTKKSEKENDRIQISAFWLSERQSPYAYNFLKKCPNTSWRADFSNKICNHYGVSAK